MPRDETPKSYVPTEPDKEKVQEAFLQLAERLLPQLTDEEWKALRDQLEAMRRRLRQVQFDQRIGYFY
ncbi:MAG: hypothetical protein KatS3mg115_2337 [Candidatus Poribacteria bacterium]|nr:MAG: hypothetical protein KatS3mg115_2337 [Candidatus Poribacteria bacterium]